MFSQLHFAPCPSKLIFYILTCRLHFAILSYPLQPLAQPLYPQYLKHTYKSFSSGSLPPLGGIQGYTLYWEGLAGQNGGSVHSILLSHHCGAIPRDSMATVLMYRANGVLGQRNSTAVLAYILPEGRSFIGEPAQSFIFIHAHHTT